MLYGSSTIFVLTVGSGVDMFVLDPAVGAFILVERNVRMPATGAMVADVRWILLKGGVFLYPPTQKAPGGKLRLMYEANPMAMIVQQAGGRAIAAPGQRILDVQPTGIHQRTPVIMGSEAEVAQVAACL